MEYVIVDVRFSFFNGKNNYTVEYSYGLKKWFVFKDNTQTNALYIKDNIKMNNANLLSAEGVLNEYLKTL